MRIFISYASEDHETADKIFLSLVKRHKVFFDHTGLKGGDDFDDKIREEVKKCDLFIFLISPNSIVKSSYALTELMFAREKWSHPEGHVLPVMISETNFETVPAYLKAVTILEPEGNLAAEVRARVDGWRQEDSNFVAGIIKYIGVGIGAVAVLAAIVFAVIKFSGSKADDSKSNEQPFTNTPVLSSTQTPVVDSVTSPVTNPTPGKLNNPAATPKPDIRTRPAPTPTLHVSVTPTPHISATPTPRKVGTRRP